MSEKKFSLGNILKKINEEEGAKQAASPESPDVSASPESQSPEEQFSRLPEKDDLPAQPVFGNGYRRTSSAPQPLSSKRWEDATKSFRVFNSPDQLILNHSAFTSTIREPEQVMKKRKRILICTDI